MAEVRANQTPEERQNTNAANAAHMAEVRANQTPEERQNANLEQRDQRNKAKTHVEFKDAMRTVDILRGAFIVASLHTTEDRIGTMTVECPDCKALKFPGETPSSCCQSGKVTLQPYPKPPEALAQLWTGNDERSKVIRKFSRTLNNGVCLTSLKNFAPRRDGWQLTAIFQGRVTTLAGPLLPGDGEQPHYSQLYVLDASLDTTYR